MSSAWSNDPELRVQHLTMRFGGLVAIGDLSFDIWAYGTTLTAGIIGKGRHFNPGQGIKGGDSIINDSVGGTRIDQHQRNESNPQDLNTIYGRILTRIKAAGRSSTPMAVSTDRSPGTVR